MMQEYTAMLLRLCQIFLLSFIYERRFRRNKVFNVLYIEEEKKGFVQFI